MKSLFASLILAALLWAMIFSPWTAEVLNFWFALAFSSTALAVWGILAFIKETPHRFRWRHRFIAVGIASATILYGIFFLGHLALSFFFPFAVNYVEGVYCQASLLPLPAITVLLLVIAPSEEIFWRGFVQQRLSGHLGRLYGLLVGALAYSIVHIWSFNPTLLVAALICGLFWGCILIRFDSLWPGIISHTLWDLAIFVIWPLV